MISWRMACNWSAPRTARTCRFDADGRIVSINTGHWQGKEISHAKPFVKLCGIRRSVTLCSALPKPLENEERR